MNSKKLLDLGSRTVQHLQKRGRAVQNWKRPTMDEYPVPTERQEIISFSSTYMDITSLIESYFVIYNQTHFFFSWSVVSARTNKKYNTVLAGGLTFFGLTSVFCWFDDRTVFYTVPRDLIDLKNDRLLDNFVPEEKQKKMQLVFLVEY